MESVQAKSGGKKGKRVMVVCHGVWVAQDSAS